MANARRYFRYDVMLPMHLEPVDQNGKHLGAERRKLISSLEETEMRVLNSQLSDWLEKVFDASSNALYVFYVLNHRLDYMWWMIDLLMESSDPRLQGDYNFRLKEDKKFTAPKSKESSAIAPLILGLYEAIDDYIDELHSVIDNSIEGKIFLYPKDSKPPFSSQTYVKNLDKLADSGILPAKVLRLMIEKINMQGEILKRLKEAYYQISRSDDWALYKVNLSAGGFSFYPPKDYPLFTRMDIFMDIDGSIMVCRGKVSSNTEGAEEGSERRVGIEFDLLTGEQESQITLFLQHKELRDAMATVALPY